MKAFKLVVLATLTMCVGAALAAPPSRTSGYVPKTERGQLAQQIVRKWSGYVNEVYGTSPAQWSNAMGGTFSAADLSNMRTASKRQTYEAMMGTLVGQEVTDSKIVTAMAKSNGSLDSVKTLGSSAVDLVYTMITPCRIADTRVAGGALSGNVARSFNSNGANFLAQGGSSGSCGIPADTSAVVMNVTVVNPVNGPGNMKLYPFGVAAPLTASVNYGNGQIVGNELIVKQTLGQPFDFTALSNFGTHVVIDVAGYFMAPEATALQCLGNTRATRSIAAGYNGYADAPACATGYTAVMPYCWTPAEGVYLKGSGVDTNSAGSPTFCHWQNTTAAAATVYEGTMCCRVPGR